MQDMDYSSFGKQVLGSKVHSKVLGVTNVHDFDILSSTKGLIGSKPPDCEKLPVVSFKPIKCDLAYHNADDLRKLSNDLRYLFQISKAIKSGECPEALASMNPDKLNKARWLTSANRILRLYIATKNPKKEILRNSDIHTYSLCVDTIQDKYALRTPRKYSSCHETDFRLAFCQDALNKILSARQDEVENLHHSIRYIIPQLNFEAKNCTDMILWEGTDVSIIAPQVLRYVANEELIDKLSLPDNTVPEWSFTAFPCRTVVVERTVKLFCLSSMRL
ncbi:hypothetical protein AVEN_143591-1 [Araneus ventricosus]|uniref:Uncharacterized protein n=1 Tax=Araneus ventricosus TaxID=182803 RepID=A0A4Y2APW9_ARAVE|nr:hypothetical protein AVEN_143591-1 [Araneus ventricosus]